LTVAGRETTAHLFSTLVWRLLSLPEQWRLVCEDSANIPKAIEEVLRADSSVHALMRMTTEPMELNGVRLPKGAWLAVDFASANHDEAYFPDAERFDLQRTTSKGHLAFGQGIHYCVGAPLARAEMRIALELMIQRLPGLRLAPQQDFTHVMTNPILRGLKELRLEWDVPLADGGPGAQGLRAGLDCVST
jgi:cytochrome P450